LKKALERLVRQVPQLPIQGERETEAFVVAAAAVVAVVAVVVVAVGVAVAKVGKDALSEFGHVLVFVLFLRLKCRA
jgi:hypothetical protein